MKAAILTETNNGFMLNNYRGFGAQSVKQIFFEAGADCTVFDYATFWEREDLKKSLLNYFHNSNDNVIGLSVPIRYVNDDTLNYFIELSKEIKAEIQNVKIIIGGLRKIDLGELELVRDGIDGVFIGRPKEMLQDWLAGKDLSKFNDTEYDHIFTNLNYDMEIEKPVLFDLMTEDDCLNERDVLGVEISLGCKFNCSFCDYPMRNAKKLNLNCEEAMLYTLQQAKDRYGITNFYVADDTLNESNEKLELLAKVVSQLDYKPNLVAFARLDVLSRRPEQIPLLKQANVVGLNFGIETLSKEAAKSIRKGYDFDGFVTTLETLRKEHPECWLNGCFITGLVGDNKDNFKKKLELLISKGLLDNVLMGELNIFPWKHKAGEVITHDEGWLSDIDKDPGKFGYNIDPETHKWYHDEESEEEARKWTLPYLQELVDSKIFVGVDCFSFLSVLALGIGNRKSVWEDVRNHEGMPFRLLNHKLQLHSIKHIKQYIQKKQEWISSLNLA